jgi:hypothetical protein
MVTTTVKVKILIYRSQLVKTKSAAEKRTPMSVPDNIRPKVVEAIERVFKDNKELLDKLGSDYDENGVAYWEKYEERLKYMEENGI